MDVGKDLSDLHTAVHNDIVPTSELIDKVARSFMQLSKSVEFSHTTIRDFEKDEIDHDGYGITKRQLSERDVDLTKALIECELEECRVTPEKKMTNIGLLNDFKWKKKHSNLTTIYSKQTKSE